MTELEQAQLRFKPDIFINLEPFPIGSASSRVFCGVLNRWPVLRYAVTSYNPSGTYKDNPEQKIYWQDGMPTEKKLHKLSKQLRVGDMFEFEGETYDLRDIMGVCSVVETEMGKHHVPMLDFCIDVGPDSLQTIRESVVLPRGVFLNSGNSYHFIGYDLLPEYGWNRWMEKLSEGRRLDSVIDPNFLDYSAQRGYAALRVFGYRGTDKKITPVVVGHSVKFGDILL